MDYQHVKRFKAFVERCRARRFTPLDALADGNCLLWSVKILRDQDWNLEGVDGTSQECLKVIEAMRRQVSQAWRLGKASPELQQLYYHAYVKDKPGDDMDAGAERSTKTEQLTPPRPKRLCVETIDLDTPPDAIEKQPQNPRRVKQRTRAPNWQQPNPTKYCSNSLFGPNASQEAAASSHQAQVQTSAQDRQPPARARDDDAAHAAQQQEEEIPDVDEAEMGQEKGTEETGEQASKRRRFCQKKAKTEKELNLRKLRQYLGKIGATYGSWLQAHWRQTGSKKAGACSDGLKYTDLQEILVAQNVEKISCMACKGLLEEVGFCGQAWTTFSVHADIEQEIDKDAQNGQQEVEEEDDKDKTATDGNGKVCEIALDAMVKKISPYLQAQ